MSRAIKFASHPGDTPILTSPSRETGRALPRSTSAARHDSIGPLPLVGRDAELRTLLHTLDAAERGASTTVFLAGDGGIGKTRLAETVVNAAIRRGWTTAVGRAYPVETGVPYALFSD